MTLKIDLNISNFCDTSIRIQIPITHDLASHGQY